VTRVVGGTLGGRRLQVPRGTTVRPTSDRVREALFSTLGARVVDAVVLDLFAGSGALGIEALSRGARAATFVERDRAVARVLRANLATLDLVADVRVADAARFVGELSHTPAENPFDLVLCDPPYRIASGHVADLLTRLVATGHVAADAMMVVERERHGEPLVFDDGGPLVTDARVYGDTVLYYVAAVNPDAGG
jgi:16S rRNA (guanine966-N2)-methyltransferase